MHEGPTNNEALKIAPEEIKDKANEKIRSLDPLMSATLKERVVMPRDREEYIDTVLYFRHPTDRSKEWCMEIKDDPEYVDGQLEGVIQKVYERHEAEREARGEEEAEEEATQEALVAARDAANEAITALDPSMSAFLDRRIIMPYSGEDEYEETVLFFNHPTDPTMEWTMLINTDPDYIQHKLPEVVRKVHEEKAQQREARDQTMHYL